MSWVSVTLARLFGDKVTSKERVCMQTLTCFEIYIEFMTEVILLYLVKLNNRICQVHSATNEIIVTIAIFVIPVCVQAFVTPGIERASDALLDIMFGREPTVYNVEEMTIEEYSEVVRAVILMDRLRRRMMNFKTRLMHKKVEEVARLDDEYECSICYERVEPGTIVTYLHPFCSHWFDTKCLILWLTSHFAPPRCPICRSEVILDDRSIQEQMEHWDHYFDWEDDDLIISSTEWSAINGSQNPWDIYLSLEE